MLARIANLWTYPLKSLVPHEHAQVALLADGLAGDREGALFVASYGHPRAGKEYRGKEDNRLHLLADAQTALEAAQQRGVELELREGARFFDAAPVSILLSTWLAEGSRLAGVDLEPLRFRPNIYASAGELALSEADLVGKRLHIGDCVLSVTAAILRCVTPNYDLRTGVADSRISRAIAQQRANVMGIYAQVAAQGTLAVGDPIRLPE